MSRLSGALGALRGYKAGMMRRDELKIKLGQELSKLRQYQEIDKPQAQADIAYKGALTQESGSRQRAAQLQAKALQLELDEAMDRRKDLETLRDKYPGLGVERLVTEEQAKVEKAKKEKQESEQAIEQGTEFGRPSQDTGLTGPQVIGQNLRLGGEIEGLSTQRKMDVQQELGTIMSPLQQAADITEMAKAEVKKAVAEADIAQSTSRLTKLDLTIQKKYGMSAEKAQNIIETVKAERAQLQLQSYKDTVQRMTDFGLLGIADALPILDKLSRISLMKDEHEKNMLMASIAKDDPTMYFSWYGETLLDNNSALNDQILTQLSKLKTLSGKDIAPARAINAIAAYIGLRNSGNKITIGETEHNLGDLDEDVLQGVNTWFDKSLEGSGVSIKVRQKLKDGKPVKEGGLWGRWAHHVVETEYTDFGEPIQKSTLKELEKDDPEAYETYMQKLWQNQNSGKIKETVNKLVDLMTKDYTSDTPRDTSSDINTGGNRSSLVR